MRSVISGSAESFVLPAPAEGVGESGFGAELEEVTSRFHDGNESRALAHGFGELATVKKKTTGLHLSSADCADSRRFLETIIAPSSYS